MANRKLKLSDKEIEAFRQREDETKDVMELRRLQAVRAYGTGTAIQEIVSVVGCHVDSVRQWASQYRESSLKGLQSHWSGQNAAKLKQEDREKIKERLASYRPDQMLSPDVRISQGQFWTVSDLEIGVKQWYGIVYKDLGSYRRLLHECGLTYQRTEKVYRSQADEQTILDFEAELEKK